MNSPPPPRAPLPIDVSLLAPTSIRASAGSGKTFQLTNRYLQLVAAGAPASNILATTFTRLAAGQIRDRILSRLADAAGDSSKRTELAEHLGVSSLSRTDVMAMLSSLTCNLHQMQIRTLDSFFASVVRAFAIELDLPLGADVVDEHQATQMRHEAVRLMLDERKPQELIDLLRLLTQGTSERGVSKAIDDVVSSLYALYREAPPEAWECVPEVGRRLSHAKLMQSIEHLQENVPTDDKRFIKAHVADCANARRWDWESFISKGLAGKIASGEETYQGKAIESRLLDAYEPLVEHAKAELIGRVREQTLATRELLRLYHIQLEQLKVRRRAITFDDLTAAMACAANLGDGKMDLIGYRLDARLHHLLLDEFQDTSVAQWRALEPLAQEIVSNMPPERTFFCVGDVKQSIYGWRAAEPEVFDELPRLLMGPDGTSAITEGELARSYRSSQPVIDAVNLVFESIPHNEAMRDFPDAAKAWNGGFAHHETAKPELPGYVEMRTTRRATENEDTKKDELRCQTTADLVADLHKQRPDLTIAVLTRSNDTVARMLFELGPTRRKIQVSGRGGGPLTDAPAVNAILDLLKMADHPDDTIAAFNVATSPVGTMIGLTDFTSTLKRREIAHGVRRRLVHEGYGVVLGEWVRAIASSCDERELRRLIQLVEMAGAHDTQSTLRTSDFISLVEETKVADVQLAPVQVMTVHQSKGLEFDIVVLPELEGLLAGNRSPAVVLERGGGSETGPISRICRYMNEDTRALVPGLQPLFDRHKRRTVRESLSVLYVAMTRAIHGLYMIIDPPAESEKTLPKKLSGVLRCALAEGKIGPEEIVYARGDSDWMTKTVGRSSVKPITKESEIDRIVLRKMDADEAIRYSRGLSAAAASKSHDESDSSFRFRLPDAEVFDRGVAVHAMFEQVEWIEDFQPEAKQLLQLVQSRVPRGDVKWAKSQVDSFLKMIKHPEVQRCLSRDGVGRDAVRVHREQPFVRLVDGRVQSGGMDRLVVCYGKDGEVESATIIDFKTDSIEVSDAAGAAEKHRPQLEAYRAAATEMLGIDADAISARVVFVGPGIVVEW